MLRRRFHAMGTELRALPEGAASSRGASRDGRGRVGGAPPREHLLAVRSRLGALGAQPARHAAGRARSCSRSSISRSPPAIGRAAASTRRCTTRSSPPATTARSRRCPPKDAAAIAGRRRLSAARARSAWIAGRGRIELDPGVHLDLGGIAKGYAVDRAAQILGELGPCLVDAGGDIAARGDGWPIGVDTGDGTLTLELGDGAVATSGRDRRHWTRGGEELHHIIDPATGLPAAGDLLRVTAVAATATEAEVRAKALFLAGAEDAEREANATATPALLVTLDGRTLFAGGLA